MIVKVYSVSIKIENCGLRFILSNVIFKKKSIFDVDLEIQMKTHIMIPFNFLYRWISFYDTFQIYIRTFG